MGKFLPPPGRRNSSPRPAPPGPREPRRARAFEWAGEFLFWLISEAACTALALLGGITAGMLWTFGWVAGAAAAVALSLILVFIKWRWLRRR